SATGINLGELPVANALENARKAEKPVVIHVTGKVHFITEPIVLGPQDSGLTWIGEEGAVISGGRKITGWQKQPDGLWKADVPEVKDGKWYFQQLWINGRRATRARTPNKGFLQMEDRATSTIFPFKEGRPATDASKWEFLLKYNAFISSSETISLLGKITPPELSDAEIVIPHTWDVHHYHIKEIDPAANAVLMHGPSMRELLTNEPDGRFHVENYKAALDAPGEWYLSRSGEIFYSPLPGEDMSKAEVFAPVAEKLLTIDGAKDITFKNISFQHQQWNLPEKGYGDPQAAHMMGAAVEVDRSESIHFDQCEIAHTGGYALWFRHDVSGSSVKSSHLHDLGAGGVRIGPTSQPGSTKTTNNIVVDNNIIQHAGRIFPDAIGVFLGHASDCAVTHNDIGDLYYTGISAGWHWGYGETVSHRNRYENNRIHHIGWGYTSDMGGFYNLGTSLGTVVRGNHVFNISSYRYGGWGLYTDEGSTGLLFENNLVHDTRESGFHQHYGYYNTVRNNIFAFGRNAQIQRSRPEKRTSFLYENNIIVWNPDTAKLLHGTKYNWDDVKDRGHGDPKTAYVMRKNLYWPTTGKMPAMVDDWTFQDWQKQGRDAGSIVADPQFVNLDQRDFHLKPESPAFKLGFKPWDLDVAGVRTDGPKGKAWRDLALSAKFENWDEDSKPWPSPPWSIPLKTFDHTANDTLPILGSSADLSKDKKGDSIGVSDEASSPIPLPQRSAAAKGKSLKIQDAADITPAWLPVLNLSPKWAPGPISMTFDAMSQPDADWFFEIRDGEFGAGPYFSWKKGKLTASTNKSIALADIPAGEWFRVKLTATPGDGKWTLGITRQDGSKQEFKDLPCKTSWEKPKMVLWSSVSNQKTAFFIDNVGLE
ncbi:MAG TPA: right-handed parallel beta-helix repeat-containing protein, partial [Luteolibacter sp.]|nr:right-handed parallel beta-helix repeat-containing protein [Luteolibacter sp.]